MRAAPPELDTSARCRSCGARVVWAEHGLTRRSAPLDAEPVPLGNIVVELDREPARYWVLSGQVLTEAREQGRALYVNHFSTCPHGATHRRS